MRIALVDDTKAELDRLQSYIVAEMPDSVISTFPSGEDFLSSWKVGQYDLIILDIFMDKLLGIDVAREIRKTDEDARLVFCTTSNEFASESYEVNANYYLLKPITQENVTKMLRIINLAEYERNRFITLPDGQRLILRNMLYSEYHNHIIHISLKQGQKMQTRMSQTEWEALLQEYDFFYSCSKGVVVNFHEVVDESDSMFVMSDQNFMPISRRKSKDSLDAYTKFRFRQMRKENL